MQISLIVTILNEENSIKEFLDSVSRQSKLPDEIVIVDGGSYDNTWHIVQEYSVQHKELNIQLYQKSGNRAQGRNFAVKKSRFNTILCTDAGCVLDKKWTEQISKPFKDTTIDVVAGYYKGAAISPFEKALVPYVLVMPDRINPNEFLPATRSMAFKKTIWEKVGRFPENLSHNEDYIFARHLRNKHAVIYFERSAIVYWKPRKNLKDAFIMFCRFAYGDTEAKILRGKVLLIFIRYILVLLLILYAFIYRSSIATFFLLFLCFIYSLWAIFKNYHFVNDLKAIYLLPAIQFTSDAAVLIGSILGIIRVWDMHPKQ